MLFSVLFLSSVIVILILINSYREKKYGDGLKKWVKVLICAIAVPMFAAVLLLDHAVKVLWLSFSESRMDAISREFGLIVDENIELAGYSVIGVGKTENFCMLTLLSKSEPEEFIRRNMSGYERINTLEYSSADDIPSGDISDIVIPSAAKPQADESGRKDEYDVHMNYIIKNYRPEYFDAESFEMDAYFTRASDGWRVTINHERYPED